MTLNFDNLGLFGFVLMVCGVVTVITAGDRARIATLGSAYVLAGAIWVAAAALR
jgi:uncharacterized membrane protein